MTIYDAPIIRSILNPNSATLLIGAPSSGLSSLAAYLATSIATGEMFFEQKTKQRPVLFFGDGFTPRYIDARKELDGAADYAGLILKYASCGRSEDSITDRVAENFEAAYEGIKDGVRAVVVYDGLEDCLLEPKDVLVAANIVEAATAISASALGCDYSLVATLRASPSDLLDGALRPLCGIFDRIVHVELIGASGRATVIRDRLGPSGYRATFDLVSPEIGTDTDGGSVRGAAIFPDTDIQDALSH
ncbi:hypothetical protein V1281_002643 [Nitrobacteraceae bacterium AZCC 2161]